MIDERTDDRVDRDAEVFAATAEACDLVGWDYQRLGDLDPGFTASIRWLSGYRHPRCRNAANERCTQRHRLRGAEDRLAGVAMCRVLDFQPGDLLEWVEEKVSRDSGGAMGVPDDREQLKRLYLPPTDEFVIIDVPQMQFLMIEGDGDHETDAFAAGTKWLYAAINPIKRIAKERMGARFVEPPLEVLWWTDDMADFIAGIRSKFKWQQMIVTADWVSQAMLDDAVAWASTRLGESLSTLRLEQFDEGRCVQIMHVGIESDAVDTMARLHNEFLPAHGLVAVGRHHEIYLSYASRVAPDKMRTVLRQPVALAP